MDAWQREAAEAYERLVQAELAQLETLRAFVRLVRDDYDHGAPDGGTCPANAEAFLARAEVLLDGVECLITDAHEAEEVRALLDWQQALLDWQQALDHLALVQAASQRNGPRA